MNILLEPQYLPPVQWWTKFWLYDRMLLDDQSVFLRQSYRNRMSLLGANGVFSLSIPVERSRHERPIRHLLITDDGEWARIHWQSIRSAYGRSAFFEHYAPALEAFYRDPAKTLFEFDLGLIRLVMGWLRLPEDRLALTSAMDQADIEVAVDFRNAIHPKEKYARPDPEFVAQPYLQVFADRFPFQPNLSVLDLIFTQGPGSAAILRGSTRHQGLEN